ncbi:MAG: class I SAM-dependent methyltransferase [Bacillaceae bacterium]|nr:class I SAM-dependent methyltransferase [Bacillaceae bacterium]
MNNHYYSKKPEVRHDLHKIEFELRGKTYTFLTDSGVFSKDRVDFGSVTLIECMDIPRDADVLDVGCGYGPIGITAATLADRGQVLLVDVNERAVELATENIRLNQIANAKAMVSDLFSAVPEGRTFDRILTNPPIRAGKKVVHRIFEEAVQYLKPGGQLWVVIQKKQGAPSAYEKLKVCFDDVEEVTKNKGYRVFKAVKRS